MLKKTNRLTKDKEFENVFKKNISGYNKITGLKVAPNNLDISRIGILVSAKISKKAVVRNKIKRRIREILRLRLNNIKEGFDIIVLTLPEIKEKSYKEIEESLDNNLKKLKLYKNV